MKGKKQRMDCERMQQTVKAGWQHVLWKRLRSLHLVSGQLLSIWHGLLIYALKYLL